MSLAVASGDRIRQAIPGVTVGFIHHPTKANDDMERGAGTLANAIDTVMNVRVDGGVFTLSCKYTRDLEPFAPITYELRPQMVRERWCSAVASRLSADDEERAKDAASTLDQLILALLLERGAVSGSDIATQAQGAQGNRDGGLRPVEGRTTDHLDRTRPGATVGAQQSAAPAENGGRRWIDLISTYGDSIGSRYRFPALERF